MITERIARGHTLASNAIEGIRTRSGPLYQQHRRATMAVALDPARYVFDLPAIHRRLFGGQLRPRQIGRYRTCGVMMVGKHQRHHLPLAGEVPALMRAYYALIEHVLTTPCTPDDLLRMHALVLCIHPFTDGNGRATRLHHNAMRLVAGYDWLIISPTKRGRYYAGIRAIERDFFPEFREHALRRDT